MEGEAGRLEQVDIEPARQLPLAAQLDGLCQAAEGVLAYHFAQCRPIAVKRVEGWLECSLTVSEGHTSTVRFVLRNGPNPIEDVLDGLVRFEACLVALTGHDQRSLPLARLPKIEGTNVILLVSRKETSSRADLRWSAEQTTEILASKLEQINSLLGRALTDGEVAPLVATSLASKFEALGEAALTFATKCLR